MKEIKIHGVYDQPTVFHITQYKCGSQWVAEVLKWCAYRRVVLPEEKGNHAKTKTLVQGLVYPTVYIDKNEFEVILSDNPHISKIKPFIVTRDMRDVLISYYFSMRNSHPKGFINVLRHRSQLKSLDEEQGLLYLIDNGLEYIIKQQVSWVGSKYPVYKYEDIVANERAMFKKILSYCKIKVEKEQFDLVIKNNSFNSLSGGRKKGMENVNSHFRKGVAGDWGNHFTPRVKDHFKERFSSLLIQSGYVKNDSW